LKPALFFISLRTLRLCGEYFYNFHPDKPANYHISGLIFCRFPVNLLTIHRWKNTTITLHLTKDQNHHVT